MTEERKHAMLFVATILYVRAGCVVGIQGKQRRGRKREKTMIVSKDNSGKRAPEA